ncbi:MAG TPA: hypothetical protein VGM90_30880 [Kofleriaceae bacterium]|jgi:hypothetical protein
MRFLIAAAVASVALASACSGKSSSSAPPGARFLPASPDVAIKLDMPRLRAWGNFAKAAPLATTSVEMLLASAKEKCGLDVLGTATSIIGAKKGVLMSGDVTVVVGGLPKDTVTGCLDKVASAKSVLELVRDGDLFQVSVQGRSVASGAILPSGDVVLVERNGSGIAAADWRTEVSGSGPIPSYWDDLNAYGTEPILVRVTDPQHVIFTAVGLTNGAKVRAKLSNTTPEGGERDRNIIKALLEYIDKAKAGTGKVDSNGGTTFVELNATGDQEMALVQLASAGLFARNTDLVKKATQGPVACDDLRGAVQTYMQEALRVSAPEQQQQMAEVVARVITPLQAAYVDSCTSGKWTNEVIACHIDNAKFLPSFEKCRLLLPEDTRAVFDAAVGAVLSKEMPPPAPPATGSGSGSATGSGSAAGSGSATK